MEEAKSIFCEFTGFFYSFTSQPNKTDYKNTAIENLVSICRILDFALFISQRIAKSGDQIKGQRITSLKKKCAQI